MPAASDFRRDDFTRVAYALMTVFGLIQASLGPAMPLLRESLGLDRTRGGLHFSVMAAGVVATGVIAARLIGRIGRRAAFWGGAAGMASGLALIGLGHSLVVTLTGAGIVGILGTLLLSSLQAALADRHGPQRAVAFSEANVMASVGTICGPLLIGGLAYTAAGWRAALLVPLAAVAIIALAGWRVGLPPAAEASPAGDGRRPRLPAGFWVYGAAVVPAVAAEWSLAGWGAGFLVDEHAFPEAQASLLLTFFFVAMTAGRVAGAGLVRRADVARLLVVALLVALAGALGFRLAPWGWLAVAALFLAGLGLANLFPFLLSLALGAVPEQTDAASARVVQVGGLAILIAPQTLGIVADRSGIASAMLLVPVLLVAALVMITLGRRVRTAIDPA